MYVKLMINEDLRNIHQVVYKCNLVGVKQERRHNDLWNFAFLKQKKMSTKVHFRQFENVFKIIYLLDLIFLI